MKKTISILMVTLVIFFCLTACSVTSQQGMQPEFSGLSYLTISAVRSYMHARLMSEAFCSFDFESDKKDELAQLVDDTIDAWDCVISITNEIPQTAAALASDLSSTETTQQTFTQKTYAVTNAKTWARNISGQFDTAKGISKLSLLGTQLSTDAKSAYNNLTEAQDVLSDSRNRNTWNAKCEKIANETAKAFQTGLFFSEYVVNPITGVPAQKNYSLSNTTGVLIKGIDIIADVGSDTCNLILGMDFKTISVFDNIKSYFDKSSYVFGISVYGESNTNSKLSFLGENFAEWFEEGKITGIGADENGINPKSAVLIDTIDELHQDIQDKILKDQYPLPKEDEINIDTLIAENFIDTDKYLADLDLFLKKSSNLNKATDIAGKYKGETVITTESFGATTTQAPQSIEFEIKLQDGKLVYINNKIEIPCNYDAETGRASAQAGNLSIHLIFDDTSSSVAVSAVLKAIDSDSTVTSVISASKL